jgi:hypothetical protein
MHSSREDLSDGVAHSQTSGIDPNFGVPFVNSVFSNAQAGQAGANNPLAMGGALKPQQPVLSNLQNPASSLAQTSINPLLPNQKQGQHMAKDIQVGLGYV